VSKRHQSNRRKTYGRRQHELQERRQRDPQPDPMDLGQDDFAPGSLVDRFAFLDPHAPRLRYATGE
jgi:hypothetical protein